MHQTEKAEFLKLLAGVFAYHRQAVSAAVGEVYWRGCQRWSLEEVRAAMDKLTADPEAGKFVPKIGDLARVLEGTTADQAQVAWNTVYEALSSVGAYRDVVFDDPATMAAVHDIGGWTALCRTNIEDIGYRQAAFLKAHRAYASRGDFQFPALLSGDRNGEDDKLRAKGLPVPAPTMIGNPAGCRHVLENGGKTAGGEAMVAIGTLAMPLLTRAPQLGQDATFNGKAAK